METGSPLLEGNLQQILHPVAVHWLEAGIEVDPEVVQHPAILAALPAAHQADRYRSLQTPMPEGAHCRRSDRLGV